MLLLKSFLLLVDPVLLFISRFNSNFIIVFIEVGVTIISNALSISSRMLSTPAFLLAVKDNITFKELLKISGHLEIDIAYGFQIIGNIQEVRDFSGRFIT
jgi:hypothetical protein